MIDIIFIILTLLLCVGAYCAERNRREIRRRLELLREIDNNIKQSDRRADRIESKYGDNASTVRLIGETAYRKMCLCVEAITRKHIGQQRAIFPLNCPPLSRKGKELLHKLLPGDSLQINYTSEQGVPVIDVYAQGICIGRIALDEVDAIMEITRNRHITGIYVAEQNCYGIPDSLNLDIILYLIPKSGATETVHPKPTASVSQPNLQSLNLSLN